MEKHAGNSKTSDIIWQLAPWVSSEIPFKQIHSLWLSLSRQSVPEPPSELELSLWGIPEPWADLNDPTPKLEKLL